MNITVAEDEWTFCLIFVLVVSIELHLRLDLLIIFDQM